MHQELLATEKTLTWLKDKRGLERVTVEQFQIGIKDRKFSIPIYDIYGEIVNVRMYNPRPGKNEPKVTSWKSGYGSARLFPAKNLYKETIMLCEGEMD